MNRDDLNEILRVRRTYGRTFHGESDVILWDTAEISDLMPLMDKPIGNLQPIEHDTAVVLSMARRNDLNREMPIIFTYNPEHSEHFAFSEDQRVHTGGLLGSFGEVQQQRGYITMDNDAFKYAMGVGFLPEMFIFTDDGGFGSIGTRIIRENLDAGWVRDEKFSFTGPIWSDDYTMMLHGYDIPKSAEPVFADSHDRMWRYVCSYGQNLLWCIQHPDQFPIQVSSASSHVIKNDHKRLVKKSGQSLTRVRVIDLRPRVQLLKTAPTGNHRNYKFSFFVRGHWRHLASGKVAWVPGYWKATDRPRIETETVVRF